MRSFLEDSVEQENNLLLVDVPTQSEPRDLAMLALASILGPLQQKRHSTRDS